MYILVVISRVTIFFITYIHPKGVEEATKGTMHVISLQKEVKLEINCYTQPSGQEPRSTCSTICVVDCQRPSSSSGQLQANELIRS